MSPPVAPMDCLGCRLAGGWQRTTLTRCVFGHTSRCTFSSSCCSRSDGTAVTKSWAAAPRPAMISATSPSSPTGAWPFISSSRPSIPSRTHPPGRLSWTDSRGPCRRCTASTTPQRWFCPLSSPSCTVRLLRYSLLPSPFSALAQRQESWSHSQKKGLTHFLQDRAILTRCLFFHAQGVVYTRARGSPSGSTRGATCPSTA